MGIPRIILTAGEPAGIGPDLICRIAQQDWDAELVIVADENLILQRAQHLHLNLQLSHCDLQLPAQKHTTQTLKIIPLALATPVTIGKLDKANAEYVITTLKIAAQACLSGNAQAVVTGPVHKGIINAANIPFSGHTEFFAELAHVSQTIMLFVVKDFKVALVTTHLPLAKVPAAITQEHLANTLILLNREMQNKFGIKAPRILICGLNPHAGEDGYMGREEIDVMQPVIQKLYAQGLNLTGPLSADTIFTSKYLQSSDVILAMYHDQALPVVKYAGFGDAVNMTLGLPFIRTSVDHGTALAIAGTTQVDCGSMRAAIKLALLSKTLD